MRALGSIYTLACEEGMEKESYGNKIKYSLKPNAINHYMSQRTLNDVANHLQC